MHVGIIESTTRTLDLYDEQFARVLAGAGTPEIIDAVVAGCDTITAALVVDGVDCEVARAPASATLDPRRDRWVLDLVVEGHRAGRPVVVPREGVNAVFHPATVSGRYVGGLVVLARGDVSAGFVRTVGRFAGLYSLVAARDLALLPPGGVEDLPVIKDLLTHHTVDSDLRVRAARAGIDLSAEWTVAVVGPNSRADPRRIRTAIGDCRFDLVSIHGGVVVVMAGGADAAGTASDIAAGIRRTAGIDVLVCAVSVDHAASGGVMRAYELVAEAERFLRVAGRRVGAVDVAALPAYVSLLKSVSASELADFVGSLLGPLREFDAATSSELVRTVAVFFEENMNTAATARRLGLHPNTVIKRHRRITELLGGDWGDGTSAVNLRLALSIDGLAADRPASSLRDARSTVQ